MDWLFDVAILSRIQFAATVAFHFIFVPLSIGLGLVMAINETRYYKSGNASDRAATKFWLKIFTVTFAIGVATGITMEFSFGTNWANYSRFVGDIFGAPLAAEALFAFFLESVFLGVLLFGRRKVSKRFYMISAWLVWAGSCLSALWILIANAWQQTPAGAILAPDGSKAVMTDFFAAALNPATLPKYTHTVVALLIMGAFVAMAIAALYLRKNHHKEFALRTMKLGATLGLVVCCVMVVTAHQSAVQVAEEQPTKFAMMEGMYNQEVPPLYVFGYVDTETQSVMSPLAIPGGTSFLANGTWDTVFPGLNDLAKTEKYQDMDVDDMPVQLVFQSYHLMVALFGLMMLTVILALVFTRNGKIEKTKWLQRLLMVGPVFPFLAIQAGWITAEVGRQPWVVYPSTTGPDGVAMLTNDAISFSVSAPELLTTLGLFLLIYTLILVGWARIIAKTIKKGPQLEPAEGVAASAGEAVGAAPVAVAAGASADAGATATSASANAASGASSPNPAARKDGE